MGDDGYEATEDHPGGKSEYGCHRLVVRSLASCARLQNVIGGSPAGVEAATGPQKIGSSDLVLISSRLSKLGSSYMN